MVLPLHNLLPFTEGIVVFGKDNSPGRHDPVPGKFQGCIPYEIGDRPLAVT